MPPAAILDVDGTLVDTNYQHAIAWYLAFRQHDVTLPVWQIHRHIGMGGDQIVGALAGDEVESEQGDDIRAAEKALYLASIESVSVLEGARDLIEVPVEQGRHTPWDVKAAEGAGVPAVAVLTGGFSEQELRDAGAVSVFESVADLRERLGDTPLGVPAG